MDQDELRLVTALEADGDALVQQRWETHPGEGCVVLLTAPTADGNLLFSLSTNLRATTLLPVLREALRRVEAESGSTESGSTDSG